MRFINCGAVSPTNPIMPRNDTVTDVMSDASNNDIIVMKRVFTPRVFAYAIPPDIAEKSQRFKKKNNVETATTINIIRSVLYDARPRSPKVQYTAEATCVSLAKY